MKMPPKVTSQQQQQTYPLRSFQTSMKNYTNSQVPVKNNSKVEKTPAAGDLESKVDLILEKLNSLSSDIATEVNKQLANVHTTIQEIVNEELALRDDAWKKEKSELESRIKTLENMEESRQKRERRNNVTIRGLATQSKDVKTEVDGLLHDKLGVDAKVARSSIIKTKKGQQLIVVNFDSFDDKIKVMKNKKKLAGSDIYISNDRTKKEREIQASLMKIADEEKVAGKEVKVSYRKITVDGVTWTWNDKKGLVESSRSHALLESTQEKTLSPPPSQNQN